MHELELLGEWGYYNTWPTHWATRNPCTKIKPTFGTKQECCLVIYTLHICYCTLDLTELNAHRSTRTDDCLSCWRGLPHVLSLVSTLCGLCFWNVEKPVHVYGSPCKSDSVANQFCSFHSRILSDNKPVTRSNDCIYSRPTEEYHNHRLLLEHVHRIIAQLPF